MNSKENLRLSGKLNIVLTDAEGNIKANREVHNLVVSSGLTFIASRMAGTASGVMSHMALGSGTTPPAGGNIDLGSIIGSRVGLTSTTPSDNTVAYVASFGPGVSTGAVTEAGIFNASTSGTMLCRTVFDVINKGALDTMTITWTITLAAV